MMHHCQVICKLLVTELHLGKKIIKKHHYPVARQSPGDFQQCMISGNDLKELYLFSCWRKHLCFLIASLYDVWGMWKLTEFFNLNLTFWLKNLGGKRGCPNPAIEGWILARFSILQLDNPFTWGPTSLIQLWRTGFGHHWYNENMPGSDNTVFFFPFGTVMMSG